MKNSLIIIGTLLLLSSCFSKEEGRLIASVNKKHLLLSDVLDNMPNQIEDSTYFVEKFMNDWIRKELMRSHAEMNLSADLFNYEKQIDDYRSSLLIYAYQQELLNQNFDTTIFLSEIEDYYEQYKDAFKLSKNIFKGRFIVVDKSAPDLRLLNKWYKSDNIESIEKLVDYCQQFAKEYYLPDRNWKYFSDINNRLPNLITEEEYFLQRAKGVWLEDDIYRYYIYIKDYQIKGSISPLAVEKEKIKNILLNKKKIEYLKQLEDELYENGLALRKIKIY
jgi:hypothetical protein